MQIGIHIIYNSFARLAKKFDISAIIPVKNTDIIIKNRRPGMDKKLIRKAVYARFTLFLQSLPQSYPRKNNMRLSHNKRQYPSEKTYKKEDSPVEETK